MVQESHLRRRGPHSVFGTGALLLCQPSGVDLCSTDEDHKSRRMSKRLVNRKPQIENGCQAWTRTKTCGLTGRRATVDTTRQSLSSKLRVSISEFERGREPRLQAGNSEPGTRNSELQKSGAAGRNCTCMISFRRRKPRLFGHGSEFGRGLMVELRVWNIKHSQRRVPQPSTRNAQP